MNIDKRNDILRQIDKRLAEIIPYVLLWGADHTRLLYWNRFGTPKYVLDKFYREDAITKYWWIDQDKNAALQNAMQKNVSLKLKIGDVHYSE